MGFIKKKLDRNSSVPLYIQLRNILREAIGDGVFSREGRIPGELDLCRIFSVSRNTVTQALALLAEEKLVCRIKKRGTVLRSRMDIFDPQNTLKTIAIVFPVSSAWKDALSAMKNSIDEAAFSYRVYTYPWKSFAAEKKQIRLAKGACDAMILYPNGLGDDYEYIQELADSGYPLVLFDLYSAFLGCSSVATDQFLGAYSLTELLLKAGARKTVYLNSSSHLISNRLRYAGFQQALATCQEASHLICDEGGVEKSSFLKLLKESSADSIFAPGFAADFSFIVKSEEVRNFLVRKKIKLVHFDSAPKGRAAQNFVLASALQNEAELGKNAFVLLKEVLKNPLSPAKKLSVAPEIIINKDLI